MIYSRGLRDRITIGTIDTMDQRGREIHGLVMFYKTQFGHHYGYIFLATKIKGSMQKWRDDDESHIWEMKLQHEKQGC